MGSRAMGSRASRLASLPISPSVLRRPLSVGPNGGARRDRTDDLMLAKHALSQLSYGPVRRQKTRRQTAENPVVRPLLIPRPIMVGLGGLEPPTSRLSSARSNQLSYKPLPENGGRRTEARFPVLCPLSSEKKERRRRRGPAKPRLVT